VPDLGVSDNKGDYGRPHIYQAALPKETDPLRLAIHVRGNPERFSVRLRELAQATDPGLRVIDPKPLPRLAETSSVFWFELLVSFTAVTLLMSLAGVYTVTAFAVGQADAGDRRPRRPRRAATAHPEERLQAPTHFRLGWALALVQSWRSLSRTMTCRTCIW